MKNQDLFSLVIIFVLFLSACGRSEDTVASDQVTEKSEREYLENSMIDFSETINIEDDIDDADEELIKEFRSHHNYTFEELKGLDIQYLGEVSSFNIYYVEYHESETVLTNPSYIVDECEFPVQSHTRIIGIKNGKLHVLGKMIHEQPIDVKGLYELLPDELKKTPLDDYEDNPDKTITKLNFIDNNNAVKLISIKTLSELNIEFTSDAENMYMLNSDQYEGSITCFDPRGSFDDYDYLPENSKIIDEEFLNYYIGLTGLVTLNIDDDTLTSGEDGTHNAYYAFMHPSDNVIYMFTFTGKDKSEDTQKLFKEMLESMRILDSEN